jgi:hypothetical protein
MLKINKELGDPIQLVWMDAYSLAGWVPIGLMEDEPEDARCETHGIFIQATDKFLIIAHTLSNDEVLGLQYIPIGWIRELDNKPVKG